MIVPQGKAGYLKWREELKKVHAATVVQLMQQAGYPPESCEKVQRWILKREIKSSAENQVGVGWGWAVQGWVWNMCVCVGGGGQYRVKLEQVMTRWTGCCEERHLEWSLFCCYRLC